MKNENKIKIKINKLCTSVILHKARTALARYNCNSFFAFISFCKLLVTINTSSAIEESSLITK